MSAGEATRRRFSFHTADVFTKAPLSGNALAVFPDAKGLTTPEMQAIAREMALSETVFVFAPGDSRHTRKVRIFTPRMELPFAGHPTLGTAFVLGAPLQLGVITLETGRGNVPVTLERDESGRIVFGRMEQPVPTVDPFPAGAALCEALGVAGSELPIELYDNGATHLFVALGSEDDVAALRPNVAAVVEFGATGVSCFAGSGDRWKTRMFWAGGEDAATGSAAGPLACHLARHGRIAWGDEIVIFQGAEIGRPSTLYARAEGGAGLIDRVEVGGQAVTVARGEFRL